MRSGLAWLCAAVLLFTVASRALSAQWTYAQSQAPPTPAPSGFLSVQAPKSCTGSSQTLPADGFLKTATAITVDTAVTNTGTCIAGFGMSMADASAQTISDRLHDPFRRPGVPLVIGMLGEPVPMSVEQLTKSSDLVVEARVSALRTYIDATDTAILTEYAILPVRVLADGVPTAARQPGLATPLRVTVYGGEVIRDGVTVRAENHDLEALKNNVTYLMFLKNAGAKAGSYQIYNAGVFELVKDTARPLASHGRDLYRDVGSGSYNDIAVRIAAVARSK